jgi:Flp pilus assembly protein protease CpaA
MALMLFFSIILLIGVVTTFTDLKNKKIYNHHLAIGAIVGLMATAYTAFFKHEPVMDHIVNGLAGFLVGWLLHQSALWRGGDAKLFTLYAFLMPTPVYTQMPFPSVINLFACSFIAGTIILTPFFIKDIATNYQALVNTLLLPTNLEALLRRITSVVAYSWILFPLYYLAKGINPAVFLTVSYLMFTYGIKSRKAVEKHYIREYFKRNLVPLLLGFFAGLIMRILLSPDSLSFPALARYIITITASVAVSLCIHTTFDHFKDYHERVPFAPLLFMGCILSYTPFLTVLTHLCTRWNILLYR